MSRKLIFALVLLVLLHAYAAAARPFNACGDHAVEHMMLHARFVPHHVEHDGSIHFERSGSSGAHQLDYDSDFDIYGLITRQFHCPTVSRCQQAPVFHPAYITYPVETPPVPPPRLSAVLGEALSVHA